MIAMFLIDLFRGVSHSVVHFLYIQLRQNQFFLTKWKPKVCITIHQHIKDPLHECLHDFGELSCYASSTFSARLHNGANSTSYLVASVLLVPTVTQPKDLVRIAFPGIFLIYQIIVFSLLILSEALMIDSKKWSCYTQPRYLLVFLESTFRMVYFFLLCPNKR